MLSIFPYKYINSPCQVVLSSFCLCCFKPRGIHGEHSESTGEDAGVFDISNRRRLGLSEVQCVQDMYNGVKKLLEIEKAAIAYVLTGLQFNLLSVSVSVSFS